MLYEKGQGAAGAMQWQPRFEGLNILGQNISPVAFSSIVISITLLFSCVVEFSTFDLTDSKSIVLEKVFAKICIDLSLGFCSRSIAIEYMHDQYLNGIKEVFHQEIIF